MHEQTDQCFPTLDSSRLAVPHPRARSRPRGPGPAPAPLPVPGPAPSPFPFPNSSAPPKLRKEPPSPGCRELPCLQRNKARSVQPSSLGPSPAFSKGSSEPSAPLPQPSPGREQTLPSLMSAEMEQHKGSTEKAMSAFHKCPHGLFASSSNQSTAFAGQQRTSYSLPLRREIKLSWLSTDLISWSVTPAFNGSPASCLMVSQLQQLCRGMCQILLPTALHLCHILPGLMMDLDSFS